MAWIKEALSFGFKKQSKVVDNTTRLILLVCLPCFLVTTLALFLANFSFYVISFILIILTLICSYAVVASKQNSQYQVRTLANLIESMIDGDYSLRGRQQSNQAFQELFSLINRLAETLALNKLEAKESRLLLERIMAQMDAMVLATDEVGYVVMANASAKKLLLEDVKQLDKIDLASQALGGELVKAQSGIIEFDHGKLSGEHFLFKESFLSEGKTHQLYLLTSAGRLLMEKERQAWQSLLRVLSHEMNNSLTPIATISQSMVSKLKQVEREVNRESLLNGISIINERADSLSHFIASYSELTHLPLPNKASFSFNELVNSLTPLFSGCEIQLIDQDIRLHADKGQFEQVLINLFKNAVEAMSSSEQKVIAIKYIKDEQWQHITICDHGSGISNLDNIFIPFYTTKTQGSGIGLALCRQILFNHNGVIKITNRINAVGVEVRLSLPC